MATGNPGGATDRAALPRKRLGEIFVEKGLLTSVGAERLVDLSKRIGKRFGTVLEDLGLVTGEELAEALAVQYRCKVVKEFHRLRFAPDLFTLVPVEAAVENTLFPLKVESGKLAVAISDPTNVRVISNIGANNGLVVVPFIATRRDIRRAISLHYLGRQEQTSELKRILVVEDDKRVRTSLATLLGREGYEVVTAEDGMEGFRELVASTPDLVITGKDMPKIGGYAFFDAVRSMPETARTPVILVSATATAEEEAGAFEKGFFDFMPKPIKEATLCVKVRRAIASSSIV
ncbi:response regulator [Geomonas sp. RF6]|uniref:response regulator n=1 Tax=Geomonas sp. RF6 TaxID=2897342 RepID=UPI001E523FCD|nr:response regulator [Geomonas sp. RF6]UFS72875.1 response regulator [Geomonas sp. RF6]